MRLKVQNLLSQVKNKLSDCLNKLQKIIIINLEKLKPLFSLENFKVITNLTMVILAIVVVYQNADLRKIQISTAEVVEGYEAQRLNSEQIGKITKHLIELESVEKNINFMLRNLNRTRVSKVANNICNLDRLEYLKKEVPKNIVIVKAVLNDLKSSENLNVHETLFRINDMAKPFAQMEKRVKSYEFILKNMEECLIEVQFL